MDDLTVEDDKKRFDAEAPHEEDTQPDPDEELMLDRGNGRVWLVKVSISLNMRPKTTFILLPYNFEELLSYHASCAHFPRYLNT